ncbi:response regulator [Telluribacter sp. SYSU D00476]|uniref:response regulator n=1 Tax=Telluribacter sp. SYSU D00476 TaxID=2811430 RepID=UPI001FF24D6C|nr:response regulator [Telluribacter sp. SYSU D00476]
MIDRRNGICLLIDDDVEDHEIFTIAMIQVNPYVDCVTLSSTAAIRELRTKPEFVPDVIFLDLNMPDMDGKQTIAELKRIDRLQQTPIIIFSTLETMEDVNEMKELGSFGYVVKPSSIEELVKTLGKVFNHYSLGEGQFFYPRNPFRNF